MGLRSFLGLKKPSLRKALAPWPPNAPWSDASLLNRWGARAKMAAALIPPESSVLDLGCGAMTLKTYLAERCTYVGCDIVARDEHTLVCDFNRGQFPCEAARAADCVTLLGVIEYMEDADWLVGKIAQSGCPLIVASYHPTDLDPDKDWSKHILWKCLLSSSEFSNLFDRHGYSVEKVGDVSPVQHLYTITRQCYIAPTAER